MRRNAFAPRKRRDKVFSAARFTPGKLPKPKRDTRINPDRFINKAVAVIEEDKFIPEHKFTDFGFIPALERNLADRNYEHPTPVQDGAIPHVLQGRDVIGIANTGTGKTAAFSLPIIHKLKTDSNPKPALIIAPTRELAGQIDDEFKLFAKNLQLYSTLCLGGMNINPQIKGLRRNPHVVIGTPGRLKDLAEQGVLHLNRFHTVVLDEADRMLDMGFIKDVRFLLERLPKENRQSLCFSATMPSEIQRLVDTMLDNPVTISVRTRETADNVEQGVVEIAGKTEKVEKLIELLKQSEFDKVLVFGRTKWSVQRLSETLTKRGLKAEAIHGNKSQPQRQRALKAFKDGSVGILVATDVAARGLDIPNVSHVINFDPPEAYEDYVHRIGRTGRAGKTGHALTFVQPRSKY